MDDDNVSETPANNQGDKGAVASAFVAFLGVARIG